MPGPIKKEYSIGNKNIAVVSELGNNFQHVTVGTTVFTNNITKSDVKDWEINHLAAGHLVSKLNELGIKATEVESDFFTPRDGDSLYTISQVKDEVVKKITPLGFDSLLIIKPTRSENFPFFLPGYGRNTRYFLGEPSSCIYAMYILELYDLSSRETIGWDWVNARKGPCQFKNANDITVKDDFASYSTQEKADIRARLESWIKNSLDESLKSLQLSR
jgi:hypothetical protein